MRGTKRCTSGASRRLRCLNPASLASEVGLLISDPSTFGRRVMFDGIVPEYCLDEGSVGTLMGAIYALHA